MVNLFDWVDEGGEGKAEVEVLDLFEMEGAGNEMHHLLVEVSHDITVLKRCILRVLCVQITLISE